VSVETGVLIFICGMFVGAILIMRLEKRYVRKVARLQAEADEDRTRAAALLEFAERTANGEGPVR
jgi:hypothetical protein